jgi:hypothetical protein
MVDSREKGQCPVGNERNGGFWRLRPVEKGGQVKSRTWVAHPMLRIEVRIS